MNEATAAPKADGPALALVHSVDLTPTQEIDLIAYINYEDGLRSNSGALIQRMSDGTFGVDMGSDPEEAIIATLDRVAKNRLVHRVMCALGKRARILTQAYLIQQMPPDVMRTFGRQSGIVLGLVSDVEGLCLRCHRLGVRNKAKGKPAIDEDDRDDKSSIASLRILAVGLYTDACRAYARALREERGAMRVPDTEALRPYQVPHVCRVGSPVHRCPCGGERP